MDDQVVKANEKKAIQSECVTKLWKMGFVTYLLWLLNVIVVVENQLIWSIRSSNNTLWSQMSKLSNLSQFNNLRINLLLLTFRISWTFKSNQIDMRQTAFYDLISRHMITCNGKHTVKIIVPRKQYLSPSKCHHRSGKNYWKNNHFFCRLQTRNTF